MGCQRPGRVSIVSAMIEQDQATEPTLGDLLVQLRRIADALESQTDQCGEARGEASCALLPGHRGFHVTADGRVHWLDDE